MWIQPSWADPDPDSESSSWSELRLKGANWAGFQTATGCVHELWKYNASQYIDFLVENNFNAVRLPVNAAILTWETDSARWANWGGAPETQPGEPYLSTVRCGEYNGRYSMDILDDVLGRLRDAGIFVMLDVHSLSLPEGNQGDWCMFDACDKGASV